MITNEELQSKTISFLRFPLIVGVVLIHSHFDKIIINGVDLMEDGSFPIYANLSYLFSEILSKVAVPLFFFISGFLFFHKIISFTAQTYLRKLKKRVKTILVPYLFWNLLVILFFFLAQTFLPSLMSGKNKLISDYGFSDWLWAFWNINMINPLEDPGAYPVCYQFWFIRDLMVVMLFSPLVYFLVKKFRCYVIIGLGILWLFNWWFNVVGFSITAFFFFSFGAYFSVHGKNFVREMKPLLLVVAVLYGLLIVVEICFEGEVWCGYCHKLGILIGIVLAISLSAHFLMREKWHVNTFLSESSFFIYAYHAMPLVYVIKFLFKLMQPHTDDAMLMVYVFSPVFTIFIGLTLYYLLKKFLPVTTSIITGGR